MSVKITEKDNGYRKLIREVFGNDKPIVTVGIHASEGAKEDGAATVLDVAVWNEFGTETIPERSFVRAWFDAAEPELKEFISSRMRLVVAGKLTKEQALNQMGLRFQTGMQTNIADGGTPPFEPNAPSTIAKKGSSAPLIDTGTLRSSIAYAIKEGK